ncbi:MAG TPA: hypothetical protein VE907_07140 [Gammaproteobacteria bacterium]|nr:hypothetical protein [Gammaproteobacteria bacterium]
MSFKWTEPGGTGRGLWRADTAGKVKGTWGRSSAESGVGNWQLTKKP